MNERKTGSRVSAKKSLHARGLQGHQQIRTRARGILYATRSNAWSGFTRPYSGPTPHSSEQKARSDAPGFFFVPMAQWRWR